jgi:hypothetical protein
MNSTRSACPTIIDAWRDLGVLRREQGVELVDTTVVWLVPTAG